MHKCGHATKIFTVEGTGKPKCLCQVTPPQAFRWTCSECGTEHPARGPHLITHMKSGKSDYCGGLAACELCSNGEPAGPWLQYDAVFGAIPVAPDDPPTPTLVLEQDELTAERISKLRPDDPITLIHDGRITTHRVIDTDPAGGTVTLGDRLDDGYGWQAALTYRSDNIHNTGWDGNDA